MVRDSDKHSLPSQEALFSATQAPVPNSRLFWLRLVSRRPLVLLGSLWLVTICLAAVASHRLLFTDPGKGVKASTSRPSVVSSQRSDDASVRAEASGTSDQSRTKVTLWGLSSLVGLCALGSVIISQRAQAAARRSPQQRMRRVKVKPKAKGAAGPKRLQPYSPQRDAVIVKGAQAVKDTLPLTMVEVEAEPTTAVQTGGGVRDETQRPMASKQAGGEADRGYLKAHLKVAAKADVDVPADHIVPQPEVVPPDEAHPLDWTEDSLAHALDLRQRRSLSSLM